jgi:hypothetical protein
VPVENAQVVLGCGQRVDGNRQDVVGHGGSRFLVEVVADARSVREQLLQSDLVVDQGQVFLEDRPGRGGWFQLPLLDQAHHGERGEALRPAGDGELRLDAVRDAVATVSEAVGPEEIDVVTLVDPHHT